MSGNDRTATSNLARIAFDLAHEPFPAMAIAIRERKEPILKGWRELSLRAMPHLDGLTLEEFENTISWILADAAGALQSADPQHLLGVMKRGPQHGIARFVQKHSLLDLFEEVRILRGVVIVEIAEQMQRPLKVDEAATFHAIFDIIIQQGVTALVQQQAAEQSQSECMVREVNALLMEGMVRQNELLEKADRAETSLRESELRLAGQLAASRALQEISASLTKSGDTEQLFQRFIDAAVEIMHSDMASVQLLHRERGELRLLAHHGFTPTAARTWTWVRAEHATTCGTALRTGLRCIVTDIETCDWMAGSEDLLTYRQTGIRSMQSTPLISRDGQILGVISTHRRVPHEPADVNLLQFDVLARLAADVIEHRLAEESLRESEERYRTLFDLGPVAIYSVDIAGTIDNFNRQAAKLWGRAPLQGDTEQRFCGSFKLFRPDGTFMPHEHCPMADVVSGRVSDVRDTEVIIERLDGSRVTVLVNIRPLKNSRGEVTGAVNCFYDISDRVAMETHIKQQSQALADESRRKDEFLAMLSHELRNPLAPISAALHLLRQRDQTGQDDASQLQAREVIERQVGNLTKLVSDLLEVSRVVSGRVRLDRCSVDLNQITRHAIESATPLIEQRAHALALHCAAEPIWCEADATRMEEVVINLLGNAAKYTPNGGRIEVWCEQPHGAEYAQLRVRDNGIGIDKELMPRVFELFTQADRSLARASGGLGIGLSLAQRLVALHGGSISAHSPPIGGDIGSEFIVRLPLGPAPVPSHVPPQTAAKSPDAKNSRVLVVDDNIDSAMILASILRHAGHTVRTASDGPAGLKSTLEWRPDFVLLDIGLPGLDGYEVARRLRSSPELKRASKSIKLIALTGYGSESDIAMSREAGFDAHLTKPVDLDELEKLISGSNSRG